MISNLDVVDYYSEYDYEIEDNTLILRFAYQTLDTPDGQVKYYVANSNVIDQGRIVANKGGSYSIVFNDTFSDGLTEFFLVTEGVFLTFIFMSLAILCTVISTAVYDSKYYKKRPDAALQKSSSL